MIDGPMNDPLSESLERGRRELANLQSVPLSEIPNLSRKSDLSTQALGFPKRRTPETRRLHPFEVFIVGFTDADATTARVQVGTGTILKNQGDISSIATIANKDAVFEVSVGEWIWIAVEFAADGDVTSCSMESGASWANFPETYEITGETNSWIQPIAQLRPTLGDKIGEHPLMAGAVISQKTNSHLVVVRGCMDGDLIYALKPGMGGDDSP